MQRRLPAQFLLFITNAMRIDLGKYKAFFFDFDGVIVDSLDIKTRAFGELFSKYGKDISKKVMAYHRNNGGVSRYEKFKHYYKNLLNKEINPGIINRLDKDYSKLVVRKVIASSYIKGVLPFIRKLNKAHKDCFIVSGTPVKEIRHILKQKKIDGLFVEAVGSPLDKTSNLKNLLRKYSIDSRQAVFFGDAKSDYEAAKKNRVSFVAVVNGISRELSKIENKLEINDFVRPKIVIDK